MSENAIFSGAINSGKKRVKECFKTPFSKIQWTAYCGLFIGIYIILYYCNINITATIQFRLGFLAIAIAGMIGGPLMGLTVGALGDILSMIITSGFGQTFFFGFTFSYALMGFIFGFIFYKRNITIIRSLCAAITEFVISLFIVTEWLNILYYDNAQYLTTFYTRIPKCIIMFFLVAPCLYLILRSLSYALRKAGIIAYN